MLLQKSCVYNRHWRLDHKSGVLEAHTPAEKQAPVMLHAELRLLIQTILILYAGDSSPLFPHGFDRTRPLIQVITYTQSDGALKSSTVEKSLSRFPNDQSITLSRGHSEGAHILFTAVVPVVSFCVLLCSVFYFALFSGFCVLCSVFCCVLFCRGILCSALSCRFVMVCVLCSVFCVLFTFQLFIGRD